MQIRLMRTAEEVARVLDENGIDMHLIIEGNPGPDDSEGIDGSIELSNNLYVRLSYADDSLCLVRKNASGTYTWLAHTNSIASLIDAISKAIKP